jgi:hypothetical protein
MNRDAPPCSGSDTGGLGRGNSSSLGLVRIGWTRLARCASWGVMGHCP